MSDRTEISLVRRGPVLRPATIDDLELLETFPLDRVLAAELSVPVNERQHRLYQSCLSLIASSGVWNKGRKNLSEHMKVELGWSIPVKAYNGEMLDVPRRQNIEDADGAAFADFFARFLVYVQDRFGIDPLDLIDAASDRAGRDLSVSDMEKSGD